MKRKESLTIAFLFYVVGIILFIFITRYLLGENVSLLFSTLWADIMITFFIFLGSLWLNNSSLYDPYWSVFPPVIMVVWMVQAHQINPYTLMVLFGISLWSIRLTRNWWIDFKGFSHEDFRYKNFRNQFGSFYWIISFIGIHLFPTLIVFLAMYPAYALIDGEIIGFIWIYVGLIIMMVATLIQLISDGQRRAFKKIYTNKSIQAGLWKYSRHPNYFGEVMFWFGLMVSGFSIGIDYRISLGFVAMFLLFNLYSVPAMEKKLLENKEDYQDVIESVPRFFFRKR